MATTTVRIAIRTRRLRCISLRLCTLLVWLVFVTCASAQELPPHELEVKNSLGMRLSYIPAGRFLMGSPPQERGRQDREIQHEVELSRPFYIGAHEVTQAEYDALVPRDKVDQDKAQHPAVGIAWADAVRFCELLSQRESTAAAPRQYRLPTEAEWEFACRAGSDGLWSFGNDAKLLSDYAWHLTRKSEVHAQAVGQKEANAWGLHDTHGNVWEWCSDWYAEDYGRHSPPRDPRGPAEGLSKVIRGGCYLSVPAHTRSATRFHDPPQVKEPDLGFRVVLEIPDDTKKARRPNKRDAGQKD